MKIIKKIALLLAAAVLLASCTAEPPVRDVTLSVPKNVTGPYELDGKLITGVPGTDRAVLPVLSIKASEGEHSLSYHLDGEKKLSILTVKGEDVRFDIPDGRFDIPKEVWSSVEVTKEGAHVSLMVFMEDGTGSLIGFDAAFSTTGFSMPEFEYAPVAWKEEGGKLIYSFGDKPEAGKILRDGLDLAGRKWVEHTGAANPYKTLDGSWTIFRTEPVAEGLPSIARCNLVVASDGSMKIMTEADLSGIPAFDSEEIPELRGLTSSLRLQGGMDVPSISRNDFEAKFSENGSIALLRIKTDLPLMKYVRIPLLRAPDEISRITTPVNDAVLGNLGAFVGAAGAVKPVPGKDITLSDIFVRLGAYSVSDGRVTLRDVSGKWNDGKADWYSYYGAAWSGTKPSGRLVLSVPSERRTEWVEFSSSVVGHYDDTVKAHETGKDGALSKVTVGNATYTRAASPEMSEILNSLMLYLTGAELKDIILEVRNGSVGLNANGTWLPLFGVLKDGKSMAFELRVTKAFLEKLLPETVKPVLNMLPAEAYLSVIMPMTETGLEIVRMNGGSIVIPFPSSIR